MRLVHVYIYCPHHRWRSFFLWDVLTDVSDESLIWLLGSVLRRQNERKIMCVVFVLDSFHLTPPIFI